MSKAEDKDIAIRVRNVRKTFKIPLEGGNNLKQRIVNFSKRKKGYREFTPLNGISFDVRKGEFFGIVGKNGSGKSTLLKTMAGIYTSDDGYVKVNGKLVPFIELGVGFNPDLTGRENLYLNGALLGFSRDEMTAMYDEIVDFAELEEFMDERLKNYSSGMQVRLAFSIAIRAQGDILLLDEVLAVGDEAFQRKCYDYFADLKREHKTVILVTHSMSAVEMYCTRAMFIENGSIKSIGSPMQIAAEYSKSNDVRYNESRKHEIETPQGQNIHITLADDKEKKTDSFTAGDSMSVTLNWDVHDVKNVGVAIFKADGQYVYGTNTYTERKPLPKDVNSATIKYKLNLTEGKYFLKAGLFGETDQHKIDFQHEGPEFFVNRDKDDYRWGGITKLESEWV